MLLTRVVALEQRIDAIGHKIGELEQKLEALQKGTHNDILDLVRKWNARVDDLKVSIQQGSRENKQRIHGWRIKCKVSKVPS